MRKLLVVRPRLGFTLVETLVSIGVLGIFFAAIAMILSQVLQNVAESRVRTVALSLGQQKMELIRNLAYSQVGTIGGIPQGVLLPTETVFLNTQEFTVTTSVVYIDDEFDGIAPTDLVNTDYKRARVVITWGGAYPARVPVTFVTNIAPKGVETITGGGTLYIRVFDAAGAPVNNANVFIDNSVVNPQVHLQTFTNINGLVVIPGAPACITCYQVRITKGGYSSDQTYTTTVVANPLQPYATVIEGDVTQLSFAIDRLSTLNLTSYGSSESGYPLLGNVSFNLRGSKIIGYDTSDDPVYKYQFSTTTGGSGTLTVQNLEWDAYVLDFSNSSHNLAGTNPVLPLAINPASTVNASFVAIPETPVSLLVTVKDAAQVPQATASVELKHDTLPFIATKSAGATGSADFGHVFFNSLSPGSYSLKVTQPGYLEATSSGTFTGTHQQTIILNQ